MVLEEETHLGEVDKMLRKPGEVGVSGACRRLRSYGICRLRRHRPAARLWARPEA